jgi:hypothetical protein
VRTYLNGITGPRLRAIVEAILIEDKAETLVNVCGACVPQYRRLS